MRAFTSPSTPKLIVIWDSIVKRMAYSWLICLYITSLGYVTILTQAIVKYDTYGLLTLFCLGVVLVP
jgi:hypothetical protein